jgi:hypothetical protein
MSQIGPDIKGFEMVKITERFSAPTKLDFAEYGSICKTITDHGTDLYIQTCKDEEKPHWISMGLFFEKALIELIQKKDFMDECLKLYDSHESFPYRSVAKIIDIMNIK